MSSTEKELFLKAFRREIATTMRVLNAYPEDKLDLQPSEKSRSAQDLIGTFIGEQAIAGMAMKGNIDFSQEPALPSSLHELKGMYETMVRSNAEAVSNLNDEQYNAMVIFPTGPDSGEPLRVADTLWLTLYDMVHHRGQLSVYLRMAGGKVPSIYGPSADEMENVFII